MKFKDLPIGAKFTSGEKEASFIWTKTDPFSDSPVSINSRTVFEGEILYSHWGIDEEVEAVNG